MRRRVLGWTVEVDAGATRSVYRALRTGAAVRCGCPACLNFHAARPGHFPDPLRKLLASVAVDPRKEAEVRLVAPLERGVCLYAGAYAFCGEILAGRPYRGFPFLKEEVDVFEAVAPGAHVALRPWSAPQGQWGGRRCVRIEFLAALPWVLKGVGPLPGKGGRGPGPVASGAPET